MVTITMEYEGGLHCKAVHGPSGTELNTDAPKDNQGRGESFFPHRSRRHSARHVRADDDGHTCAHPRLEHRRRNGNGFRKR